MTRRDLPTSKSVTLDDVKTAFRSLRRPSNEEEEWEGSYRLLGGALYSIRRGLTSRDSARDILFPSPLPDTWVDLLFRHIEHGIRVGKGERWIHIWAASYMFTNAFYRIASATEKIAGLVAGRSGDGREVIGELKDPNKRIPPGLSKAYEYLEGLPPSDKYSDGSGIKERAKLLADARKNYPKPFPALVCAIIQADSDKHTPERPRKELEFDCRMAMESFLQVCEVFDEAIGQFRNTDHRKQRRR